MKKAVLLPDIHFPDHIKACESAIPKFIKDFKPDEIIYMGDQLDLAMISSWNEKKPKKTETQRLIKDYLAFDGRILKKYEQAAPKAKSVWITGNHEERAAWFTDRYPAYSGLIEPHNALKLRERGYDIVDFGGVYKLGKLYVLHGKYWNIYHAAKTVNMFESSCVYAHTHNPQQFAKVVPLDTGAYHIATCLGCLSNTQPDYKAGEATRWINQFAVVYLNAQGYFWLYPITINKGQFVFNNKTYR